MSTSTNSETAADRATALPGISQLTRGYQSLMKGMINVVLRQIELSSSLMEGSMDDLNLLIHAQTPDKFIQAEMEVLRRQAERSITAAQKFSEEVNRTWSAASENLKTIN